ncbi:MAG: CoA-binding protein [Calditrichaeota bacterium]|nr:MAG: CoA-binding protein [Calditrichota bacterium]
MSKAAEGTKAAVLGASPKEDRYSFKAVHMLKEHGFKPIPVHPKGHAVDGIDGVKSLADLSDDIDTLTMYVNASISDTEYDNIMKLHPRRVIFNPGSENQNLKEKLDIEGIETVEACTLVMLQTNQY